MILSDYDEIRKRAPSSLIPAIQAPGSLHFIMCFTKLLTKGQASEHWRVAGVLIYQGWLFSVLVIFFISDDFGFEFPRPEFYYYLNQTGVYTVDGTDDRQDYDDLRVNGCKVLEM